MKNEPNIPDESAWESAMSRDFDARVRDLDEAPLDFTDVKGKARTIQRNRRMAAAGGVLAVAAVITPIAVIASDNGTVRSEQPDFAEQTDDGTDAADPNDPDGTGNAGDGVDYIVEGTWVRADGTEVDLPRDDYMNAVVWQDQLVVQHREGTDEWATTEVIDAGGQVVDSFEASDSLAVSADRSILAFVSSDGRLVTRWEGGESQHSGAWASNDLPVAVTGQAPCEAESGACTVWVNNGAGECRTAGSSAAVPVPEGATECGGATPDGQLVTVVDEHRTDGTTCGGLYDFATGEFDWRTCEFQAQQISPNGQYVAAPPSQYDGLGPMSMSILDVRTGEETGRYAVDMATVTDWAWSDDNRLVMRVHDTVNWHLVVLHPDGGGIEEITDPIRAGDMDPPFVLVGN